MRAVSDRIRALNAASLQLGCRGVNDQALQQLTVFAARLYHRSLQVRLAKFPPETRTEAESRDQTRYY